MVNINTRSNVGNISVYDNVIKFERTVIRCTGTVNVNRIATVRIGCRIVGNRRMRNFARIGIHQIVHQKRAAVIAYVNSGITALVSVDGNAV